MARYLLTTMTFLAVALTGFSQQNTWDDWHWLLGKWKGEGSGQPGQGGGTFSFEFDLDRKIIVRKSHSEYPATDKKPKIVHDDLMVVYTDDQGKPSRAIYFDNEGHTIQYAISYGDKAIAFVSEKTPTAPIFRLTYFLLDNNTINTKFEMSPDGVKFMPYLEGKSVKVQ